MFFFFFLCLQSKNEKPENQIQTRGPILVLVLVWVSLNNPLFNQESTFRKCKRNVFHYLFMNVT